MSSPLMTAVVKIMPDMKGFKEQMKKDLPAAVKESQAPLNKETERLGTEAGKKGGDKLGEGLADGMRYDKNGKLRDARGNFVDSSARMGQEAGQKAVSGFSMNWDKLNSMGNKLTLGVTLPLMMLAKNSTDAFAAYEDNLAAAGQFYGKHVKELQKFGDTAAASYGMAKDEVLIMANSMAPLLNQFTTMNTRAGEAEKVIKRTADMASFFGHTTDEASVAVQSFLSGSSVEPIRQFGVFASEASTQAQALAMGLVKLKKPSAEATAAQTELLAAQAKVQELVDQKKSGTPEYLAAMDEMTAADKKFGEATLGNLPILSESQKIQARYAILMRSTAVAQGDFKRTSDSTANSMKTSAKQFKNARIELGAHLAPIMIKLSSTVGSLMKAFNGLSPEVQDAIVYMGMAAAVAGPFLKLLSVLHAIKNMFVSVKVAALGAAAAEREAAAAESMGGGAAGVAGGGIGKAAKYAGVGALALAAGASIGQGINYGIDALTGKDNAGTAKRFLNKLGIPMFADGGTMQSSGMALVGERGPELLHLPRGSQVQPLAQGGAGSTVQMTVYVQGGNYDEERLAKALDRLGRKAAATKTRTRRY